MATRCIEFTPTHIVVGAERVEPGSTSAVARLREILGPEVGASSVGVKGSGRIGHWLAEGVVLISQLAEKELVEVFVCFDSYRFGPEPERGVPLAPYVGVVEVLGVTLFGEMGEREIHRIPGIGGFGGLLKLEQYPLSVGMYSARRKNAMGKASGVRRLVQVSAEWGGPKPFPG